MKDTNKPPYPDLLWAGTEHSLAIATSAHESMQAGIFGSGQVEDEKEDDTPHLLSQQGNIGVISIRGPLVNRDSPWNRFFGITSYADIRRAVVYAAEKPEIQGILLDIDSGGGAVNGVSDTGDLISAVNKVKPVWSFTEGTMASAAYWLGSSGRKVFASKTSITGSIGVIATHMEYSKALKDEGVGVTVVRAGEYKALVNSVEPLSETAQRQLQDQLNSAYQIFIGHVAQARGTTVNLADQKMGQGREFFGAQAVDAGLVDGILAYDEVVSRFSKLLDSRAPVPSNSPQFQRGPDMKRALTSQQLAALAEGAGPAAATETDPVAAAADEPADQQPAAAAAASQDPAAPAAATATPAPAAAEDDKVVSYLQTQLAAAQDQIVDLRLQLQRANETVTSMKTTHDGLIAIAARSVSNMKVALGLSAVSVTGMSAETLLAEHTATTEAFQNSFKAGGVAAVNTEDASSAPAPADPYHRRRVAATRLSA